MSNKTVLLEKSNYTGKTKKINGVRYTADDFAYVPDEKKPSTWKLPIFDYRHTGEALAAMDSDFRGHSVEIPALNRPAVMERILQRRALFGSQYSQIK